MRQGWSSFWVLGIKNKDPRSVGVLEHPPRCWANFSAITWRGLTCPSGNGIQAALPSLLRRGLAAIRKDSRLLLPHNGALVSLP